MLHLVPFSLIFELIAAIAAFKYLRNEKENPWKWFKWFLLFVFVLELSAYLYAMIPVFHGYEIRRNHFFYKIYLPIETLFDSWVLFLFSKQYRILKRYYATVVVLFFCLFFFEFCNVSLNTYLITTDLFATLCLLIGCFLYYYFFLKQTNHVELIKYAPFWVVTGLFFFHFISFSITCFFHELTLIHTQKGFPIRFYAMNVLNFLFYGFWVYAFKIRQKQIT